MEHYDSLEYEGEGYASVHENFRDKRGEWEY